MMVCCSKEKQEVVVDADHDADEEHEEIGAVAFSN